MLRKRKRRLLYSGEDIDPMSYAVNMVDCMLVLAVGFLIFTVMSFGMQSIVFSNATPEEKKEIMETVKNIVQIKMGQELNQTPEIGTGTGSGYEDVGTVYRDPNTGKLIMVPN